MEKITDNLLEEIIDDLADNYRNDEDVLSSLLDDVINDALSISNRKFKPDKEKQILILKSNIKKATKAIYLQRGTEDVSSSNDGGISNTYEKVMETMQNDIIIQGKRVMI